MGRGCMSAHELTRSERNRLWNKVLSSVREFPANWRLEENHRLLNSKMNCEVIVHESSGSLSLWMNGRTRIDHDVRFLPWTAKNKLWNIIHKLRHVTLAEDVVEVETTFAQETKDLPLELTRALELPAEPKELARVS